MRTSHYQKSFYLLLVLLIAGLFIISCNKAKKECFYAPRTAPLSPNVTFRMVDKTTGHDLFFGSTAIYSPSQLKFTRILNGRHDTVYLVVDTTDRIFNIRIQPATGPALHYTDTVTMQIANQPQDVFLFNTKEIIDPCYTTLALVSVEFNGKVIFTPENGPAVVVLTK